MDFPQIDPIIFEIGPVAVRWYGVAYLMGFLGGLMLGNYRAKQPNSGWTVEQVSDFLFYVFLGVILGGRVGYVLFYGMDWWMQDFWYIFKIWEGGMSFHGGLIGVIAAIAYFAKKTDKKLFQVADFIAPLATVGLFFGRMANFINQELWGREAGEGFPLAMRFPNDPEGLYRHPSQLYEAFFEGLVLFVILWIFSSKPRPAKSVSGLFLLGYGSFRFGIEFFREPDAHLGEVISWLTMGQVLCVPMILGGIYLLRSAYKTR